MWQDMVSDVEFNKTTGFQISSLHIGASFGRKAWRFIKGIKRLFMISNAKIVVLFLQKCDNPPFPVGEIVGALQLGDLDGSGCHVQNHKRRVEASWDS